MLQNQRSRLSRKAGKHKVDERISNLDIRLISMALAGFDMLEIVGTHV